MKKLIPLIMLSAMIFNVNAQEKKMNPQILVAYYSWGGNTRIIAEQIHQTVGGDLFEISPVNPYSENYDVCVKQAKQEISDNFRPEIVGEVKDFEKYDIIFVGSPNWWSTIAPPVASFLTKYDFSDKIIVPFCTHGSGGKAHLFTDMEKLLPENKILEGFSVYGKEVSSSQKKVEKWIDKLEIVNREKN
jgi:flavodoxin